MEKKAVVVSFITFLGCIIYFTDLLLPTVSNLALIQVKLNDNPYHQQYDQILMFVEKTALFKQAISSSYNGSFGPTKNSTPSFMYFPGALFMVFLAIGSIYGLFYKKPHYQHKRAFYYNLIVGVGILLILIYS
jgi:hypothetical protein